MALFLEPTHEPRRAWSWQTRTALRFTTSPPTFSKWQLRYVRNWKCGFQPEMLFMLVILWRFCFSLNLVAWTLRFFFLNKIELKCWVLDPTSSWLLWDLLVVQLLWGRNSCRHRDDHSDHLLQPGAALSVHRQAATRGHCQPHVKTNALQVRLHAVSV